jgi:uncharacterized phiE125 gp8 family phage protein
MALKLITAPTALPVTLAEAKLHCRVDDADRDALITSLIGAATTMAEQHLDRAIMPQTYEVTLDAFPGTFELTRTPVASVTSIQYYDTSGVLQTLPSVLYALDTSNDSDWAQVAPVYGGAWPDTRDQVNAVVCRYVAGYADAAAVPEPIKQWVKIMVATMLSNPAKEEIAPGTVLSLGYVDRLLDRYKLWAAP